MIANTIELLAEHLTSLGMEAIAIVGDATHATFTEVSTTSSPAAPFSNDLRIMSSVPDDGVLPGNYLLMGGDELVEGLVYAAGANAVVLRGQWDFTRVWSAVQEVCTAQRTVGSAALRLLDAMDGTQQVDDFMLALSSVMGNPVVLLDDRLRALSPTSARLPKGPLASILPTQVGPEDAVASRGITYPVRNAFGGEHEHLVAGVTMPDGTHRLVLSFQDGHDFEGYEPPLLRSLCNILRISLGRVRSTPAPQDPLPGLMARAVSRSSAHDEGLADELHAAGIRLPPTFCLAVFEASHSQGSQQALSQVLRQARSAFPHATSTICDRRVLLVLSVGGEEESNLVKRLETTCDWDSTGTRCGVSMACTALEDLPRAFEQCRFAITFGTRYVASDHVLLYRRFLQFDLFSRASRSLDLSDFCIPVAARIVEHDRRNQTSYAWTLLFYLGYFKSLDGAAAELNVHRNTVGYRLARAQDLFGIDLDDTNLCNLLLFSLEILMGQEVLGEGL